MGRWWLGLGDPPPPLLPERKPFIFINLRRKYNRKILIINGCVQIIPGKGVTCYFRFLKNGSPALAGLLLIPYLSISDWVKLIRQVYLVSFEWVGWFWDLTCDFWAEFVKNSFAGGFGEAMASVEQRKG